MRYQSLPSLSTKAIALTLRVLVGAPDEVPKNSISKVLPFSPDAQLTRSLRAGVCVTQSERSEHST